MGRVAIQSAKEGPLATAGRLPLIAFLLVVLAILNIVAAGPAHALEDLNPKSAAGLTIQPTMAAVEAAYDATSHLPQHGSPGHVCIVDCGAHSLSAPPVSTPIALPSDTRSTWSISLSASPRPAPAFGLMRPPRV